MGSETTDFVLLVVRMFIFEEKPFSDFNSGLFETICRTFHVLIWKFVMERETKVVDGFANEVWDFQSELSIFEEEADCA